jgi:hypothetical protein
MYIITKFHIFDLKVENTTIYISGIIHNSSETADRMSLIFHSMYLLNF